MREQFYGIKEIKKKNISGISLSGKKKKESMAIGESDRLALQPCPNRADCMVSGPQSSDSCSDKFRRSALTLELRSATVKCSMDRILINNVN